MNRKKMKLLVRLLVASVVLILIAVIAIILIKGKYDEYKNLSAEYQSQIEANMQTVYVAKDIDDDGNALDGIKAGDVLVSEGSNANVMQQTIATGLDASSYITEDDIGSKAIVDIAPLEPIMANEVTAIEVDQDTREYEIQVADLMYTQQVNDYVDVRIMYTTGEDYLILSKVPVLSMIKDTSVFNTYLNEEEILRLASATVDAVYVDAGAKIYTTKYVESNIQDAGTPDYLVKSEVLDLLSSDPNVLTLAQETMNLQARTSLDNRLGNLTEDQVNAMTEAQQAQDNTLASAYTNGNVVLKGDNNGNGIDDAEESSSADNKDSSDSTTTSDNAKESGSASSEESSDISSASDVIG